jgi:hypothetical protein
MPLALPIKPKSGTPCLKRTSPDLYKVVAGIQSLQVDKHPKLCRQLCQQQPSCFHEHLRAPLLPLVSAHQAVQTGNVWLLLLLSVNE